MSFRQPVEQVEWITYQIEQVEWIAYQIEHVEWIAYQIEYVEWIAYQIEQLEWIAYQIERLHISSLVRVSLDCSDTMDYYLLYCNTHPWFRNLHTGHTQD